MNEKDNLLEKPTDELRQVKHEVYRKGYNPDLSVVNLELKYMYFTVQRKFLVQDSEVSGVIRVREVWRDLPIVADEQC